MIKCCIFDLDGTILDTITSITYYVNVIHEKHGVEPITVDECKYFAGNGAYKLIERSLNSKGIYGKERIESILAEYVAAYDEAPLYLTGAFEGISDMLAELKARGIKLAVLSNKPDTAVKSIVEHFFPGIFDEAAGGMDGVPLKPDPTAAQGILKRLGISESETAWVGDTSTDIETGKNLKAALSIGVLWGFRKKDELERAGADLIVSHPSEIVRGVEAVV